MNNMKKNVALLFIGAALYFEIELNWRYFFGYLPVHWSMPIIGGLLFVLIGEINEYFTWEMPLLLQSLIGGASITAVEYAAGMILNVYCNLNIWDYSELPFNIHGQICLPFFFAWIALSAVAVIFDDYFRWRLFGEDFPHYIII